MEGEREGATGRTVVLADDDLLLREGLASMLTLDGYNVVGQAGDAIELLDLVREHRPDLAIVDIRMPPDHATEGLRAAAAIRKELPKTAILVLSAYVEVKHATTLLASGQGSGYLLKSRVANIDEFLESIDRLCRGGSVVDPSLVLELLAARTAEDPLENLTAREREVLALMAEGRTNAGIGRRLWVTDGTVEKRCPYREEASAAHTRGSLTRTGQSAPSRVKHAQALRRRSRPEPVLDARGVRAVRAAAASASSTRMTA